LQKKSKELNIVLDTFEFKLLSHALGTEFNDKNKKCFKDKYKEMLIDNSDLLKDYFKLRRDQRTERYVSTHFNKNCEFYCLEPTEIFREKVIGYNDYVISNIFNDENINYIRNSKTFMFYIRNIYGNKHLEKMWSKLSYFFTDDYVDCEVSDEDIKILENFALYAPSSINTLRGMKLSEQISFINKLLEEFKEDPIIAISLLEKGNIDKDTDLDEQSKLLLELSVRREIVNNVGKVNLILGNGKIIDDNVFDI